MRLIKFLTDSFDWYNNTLKPIVKTTERLETQYKIINFESHKTLTFKAEYIYNNDKSLHFGFINLSSPNPDGPYLATRDFIGNPIKVFTGVLQGLPLALDHFPDTERLIGTAIVIDYDKHKTNLSDIYNSSSFIKAVERWTNYTFKYDPHSDYRKSQLGDHRWVWVKNKI